MDMFAWLGSTLFILCYLPQIIRAYRTKQVRDISLTMWIIQWTAYTSCLIYAIFFNLTPLIFGYAMGWLMTAWFLELYRQYRQKGADLFDVLDKDKTYIVYQFPKRRH